MRASYITALPLAESSLGRMPAETERPLPVKKNQFICLDGPAWKTASQRGHRCKLCCTDWGAALFR